VAIIVAFGSILLFHTLIYPQASIGVEETSNQSYLQNKITKEQEQKNNFENPSKNSNKILGIASTILTIEFDLSDNFVEMSGFLRVRSRSLTLRFSILLLINLSCSSEIDLFVSSD
jgi:hypothetical protein